MWVQQIQNRDGVNEESEMVVQVTGSECGREKITMTNEECSLIKE